MRYNVPMKTHLLLLIAVCVMAVACGAAEVRQITFAPQNHDMDNNDNFSPDGRLLVYDTRETVGPGIDNGQSIEVVNVETGKSTVLYRPAASLTGSRPAPGVGAASFSGATNDIAFIHGPPLEELDVRGPYGKPNRNGARVVADETVRPSGKVYPMWWLDKRDIATGRDTISGAHRGGTHRHEYTLDGRRIGFTYNDFLLPQYGRTVGYMEPHPKAPAPASHYFAVLVPVVPTGTAKPGEIEVAQGDSWIGREGLMRAFIGTIKEQDGSLQDSLFVIDLPLEVDITTADCGSNKRYPAPPKGVSIRRITHDWASGTVRGTIDGRRMLYCGKDSAGLKQLFVVPSNGSDQADDPALRPVQLTRLPQGVEHSWRWHPSGERVYCVSENAVVAIEAVPGPDFGKVIWLTEKTGPPRKNVVLSPDGRLLAFNQPAPTRDAQGEVVRDYAGRDFLQIWLMKL